MNIDKLNEQKGKRAALLKDMRALDVSTADGQAKYDAMEKDFDLIHAGIERAERLATAEASVRAERDSNYQAAIVTPGAKAGRKVDGAGYKDALDIYARRGLNGILPEFRNALQVGTSSEGGYLVPTEFETAIVALLTNMDPIRALAHKIVTASDRNIPVETSKGTFAYIAEEASYVASDPAFGQVVLSAFKSGGTILVSDELLQDSFFNLEQYLVACAGDRFNTLEETNFAGGDGSGKPKGIFATTSVAGVNVPNINGGSTSAITGDNIVDLEYSLGRQYRQNAVFVMADATEKYLRKIKTGISGDTTYAWRPSLEAGKPNTLIGHNIVITGGAPAMGSAAKAIAFADLSKYYICDRLGTSMKRLDEKYADSGQVGFRFTRRNDGRLVDALAVATLTMST